MRLNLMWRSTKESRSQKSNFCNCLLMEHLDLVRNDLLQTAATRRGTLVVFPSGANKQQKIGVADLSGVVQCLSIKRQECKTSFKSLPSRQCITSATLGKGTSQRDRLFIAENAVIRGLTKKGKDLQGILDQMAAFSMKHYPKEIFKDGKKRNYKQVFKKPVDLLN